MFRTVVNYVGKFLPTSLTNRTVTSIAAQSPGKKAVFITGCDSGFGYSLATHMLENQANGSRAEKYADFVVIAGCYYPNGNTEGAERLRQTALQASVAKEDFHLVRIDVTDSASIKQAKEDIDKILVQSNRQVVKQRVFHWAPSLY